jgi:hypothetical protein
LRAIGLNKMVGNLETGDTVQEGTGLLLSESELDRRLMSWPDALRGTAEIAANVLTMNYLTALSFPEYGTGGTEGAADVCGGLCEVRGIGGRGD